MAKALALRPRDITSSSRKSSKRSKKWARNQGRSATRTGASVDGEAILPAVTPIASFTVKVVGE
jgi:hypothetical protein